MNAFSLQVLLPFLVGEEVLCCCGFSEVVSLWEEMTGGGDLCSLAPSLKLGSARSGAERLVVPPKWGLCLGRDW